MSLREIPPIERPRERCLRHGAESLSLRECLAVLLGSGPPGQGSLGTAARLLSSSSSSSPPVDEKLEESLFFSKLACAPRAEAIEVPGLGPAGRARLLCALELGRRYWHHQMRGSSQDRTANARDPAHAAALRVSLELRLRTTEWFGFVPVLPGGRMGAFVLLENGTRTQVSFEPARLFKQVLAFDATGFYAFHNHPSGDLTPSKQDLILTQRMQKTAQLIGIELLGHAVVHARSERWIVL